MRCLLAAAVILWAQAMVASAADRPFHILAISWQPAFCEGLPHKPECRTQTEDRFDASHFSLHGLWPQPRSNEYCTADQREISADKNGRWDLLPDPRLTQATREELNSVMPGSQSLLDRHEWIKHGGCYRGRNAEGYFRDSLRLMNAINTSAVQTYFAKMTGKTIRLSDIRARFDESFGAGAGNRVRVACRDDGDRRIITELTLGLVGNPSTDNLGEMLLASRPTDGGCGRGEIDRPGLQ